MRKTRSSCARLTIRSQSRQSRRTVPTQRSANAFACGARKRRADDLDAFAPEDGVEGAAELAVTIVDQEPRRHRSLAERPRKLPRLLNGPTAIRVRKPEL